jgi:hypothetical protein
MVVFALLLSLAQAPLGDPIGGLRPGDDPGDFQTWIDRAVPGSVLRVPGRTWEPVVIDKPLTLIGDPGAGFWSGDYLYDPGHRPPITLAGPGSGKVTLVNIGVGGQANGDALSVAPGGIVGGGFEALELFQCYIEAPVYWRVHQRCVGGPGVSVSVEHVLVVESTVAASWGRDDFCGFGPGAVGIDAAGSLVELHGSSVSGSSFLDPCYRDTCPDMQTMGSASGPGVRASCLESFGSSVSPGGPSFWRSFTWTGPFYWDGTWADCGYGSTAPAVQKTGRCFWISER